MPNQSQAEYQIEWQTAAGARIAFLSDAGQFRYTKALNFEGDFSIALAPSFDFTAVHQDQRVLFSRRPAGGVMAADFSGIIRDWDIEQTSGGYNYSLSGPGPGWLLSGRRVAYYAGHASASMTDEAGDMILEIVRDNLGADATTANGRKTSGVISASLFTVQAAGTYGPSVEFKFSYNNVLDTVNKITEAARRAGTPVYWEMAPSGDGFDFRVNVGQLGQDRRTGQNAITFGPEFGNFTGGKLSFRSRAEVNRIYALGQGDGSARNVQSSEDTTRSGASPWAPRESALEDTNLTTDASLVDKADAAVLAGRPFYALSGKIISTDETQYQRDWNLGDLVNVSFARAQYTALIRAVSVSVDANGREDVTGSFEIIQD